MAWAEKYVTQAAGGGGVGSEGDPWTLAEGYANAVATNSVNIKSDGAYSIGADTITNAGTIFDLIRFRGYNSTIGDLENPGRNSDGTINKTGFPAITNTGILTPNAFVIFQNLAITGALSSALIGSTLIDSFNILECEIINTQNNSSARVLQADNYWNLINSDFECTGAAHDTMLDTDIEVTMKACRLKSNANGAIRYISGTIVGNLFIGDGSSVAISLLLRANNPVRIWDNTFYNWGTDIQFNNGAAATFIPTVLNNHATDSTKYIDDLYVATDLTPIIEMNNRTRDNTTPRTGVGDGVNSGEVTTDTGGAETDYTNAGSDDLSLISAAPGREAALGSGSPDIGAWQGAAGAGGGGSGQLLKSGLMM